MYLTYVLAFFAHHLDDMTTDNKDDKDKTDDKDKDVTFIFTENHG